LQAGELVAQGDELVGQGLEVPVISHILLDLGGLVRRHALGELFTAQETLQDVIRAARGGIRVRLGFEKLLAQAAAAEAVDGLHLLENSLPLFQKIIMLMLHGYIVSIQIQYAIAKCLSCLLFCFWVTQRSHTPFEGGFIVPLDVHLPGGWDLGVMTEFDCNQNATDSCYHLEFLNSLTFHHAIIGKLSGYGEFFGLASAERSAPWVGTLDGGLIYGFSENVQLDAGVNIGVTDAAADINPFVGFSMRF